MPNCPKGQQLCGFTEGMTVLIFDEMGHFDFFTITQVQDDAGHLQHRQQDDLSFAYQPGAIITEADSHTYYFDAVNRQLRHYDGYLTDVAVVDNVVGVLFEYFGDPEPPLAPKPPLGTANCLYDASGNLLRGHDHPDDAGRLARAAAADILNDGPWCGAGSNRFDADLLRVRKVRITLRVQAGSDMMRGTSGDFAVAGTHAECGAPDARTIGVRFEISPRNMNLGR